MSECIIDGIKHIKDGIEPGKCVLCDKHFCCCNKHHGYAKYHVVSKHGSTEDLCCNEEINRYLNRDWTIKAKFINGVKV